MLRTKLLKPFATSLRFLVRTGTSEVPWTPVLVADVMPVLAVGAGFIVGGLTFYGFHRDDNKVSASALRLLQNDLAMQKEERSLRSQCAGTVRLLLFRHAQSQANLNMHLVCGRSNATPLSEKGVEQAKKLGQRLNKEHVAFDYIFVSNADRAKQTFSIACPEIRVSADAIKFTDDVLELGMGSFVGQERKAVYTPEVLKQIDADPIRFKPPNSGEEPGESQLDVEKRMVKFVKEEVLKLGRPDRTVVVAVCRHTMAIRCLLRGIRGASESMPTQRC